MARKKSLTNKPRDFLLSAENKQMAERNKKENSRKTKKTVAVKAWVELNRETMPNHTKNLLEPLD